MVAGVYTCIYTHRNTCTLCNMRDYRAENRALKPKPLKHRNRWFVTDTNVGSNELKEEGRGKCEDGRGKEE